MLGPLAARRVLGPLAQAGAPVSAGPTVYLQTGFDGSGSIDGVTPEVGPVASVITGALSQSAGLLVENSASTRGNIVVWNIGQTECVIETRWRNDTATGRQIAVLAHCDGTTGELWRALYSRSVSLTQRHGIYERSGGAEPIRASSALDLANATFYRWRVTVRVVGGVGEMVSEIFADDGTTLLDTLTYSAFSTNLAAGRVGLQIVSDTSFNGGFLAFGDIEATEEAA